MSASNPHAHEWTGHWYLKSRDSHILERRIIPYFAGLAEVRTVLDVGCDWYTSGYATLFPDQAYHSLDIDEEQACFSKGRHQIGSLLELDRYHAAGTFDLVMANGVFGWGIDGAEDIARATGQIRRALRPDGFLVLGWNDNDEYRPEPLETLLGPDGFAPVEIAELGGASIDTETPHAHRYHFLRRDGAAPSRPA
ncbi:MAG: class I SAM-dependent methyltransferase [Acidobacteriota bacterium]